MTQTQLDAGLIFSGKASGTMISGFDEPSAYTPVIDTNYIFHDSSRDVIVWLLMDDPDPLYLCGPTSAGKSSLIRQIAARLNYPVFEATGHDRLEFPELVGHLSVRDGNMVFEDGPLTMAMKQGGIFLFNEADLCSPSTLAGLNTILDGSPLCIAENGGEEYQGRIFIALRNGTADGYYDIVVDDNGDGVKDENQSKLFTPNFTTKSGGTGLGLAICRNIIEKCEGTISYSKSFSLGGASFTVSLPKMKNTDQGC